MLRRTVFIFLIFSLRVSVIEAQYGNIEFIENKGQWDSHIRFLGQVSSGAFYVQKDGFMVLQHNPADIAKVGDAMHSRGEEISQQRKQGPITVHSHAYKVEFLNGNENPEIIADKPLPGYNNYFIGNDPSKWAGDDVAELNEFYSFKLKNL